MSWSRKNSTRCSSSRARISATSAESREAAPRSTFDSSAPIVQVRGSTLMLFMAAPRDQSSVKSRPGCPAPTPHCRGGQASGGGLEQAQQLRAADDLLAAARRQLPEHVFKVPLDGLLADLHRQG